MGFGFGVVRLGRNVLQCVLKKGGKGRAVYYGKTYKGTAETCEIVRKEYCRGWQGRRGV